MRKRRRKKQSGRRRSSKSSNLVAAMMDKMELPKIRDYISMLELILSTVLIKQHDGLKCFIRIGM